MVAKKRKSKRKSKSINFISAIIIFVFVVLLVIPSAMVCISYFVNGKRTESLKNNNLPKATKNVDNPVGSSAHHKEEISSGKSEIKSAQQGSVKKPLKNEDGTAEGNAESNSKNSKTSSAIKTFNKSLNPKLDFNKYIKVLIKKKNQVITLPMEDYIKGVVCAEVPASYPVEALKAQAVAARTYAYMCLNNGKYSKKADITDDYREYQAFLTKDERYKLWSASEADKWWNKISKAVDDTKGIVMFYNNNIIYAAFHSNSGGVTEDGSFLTGDKYPYLKSVISHDEEKDSDYKAKVALTLSQFNSKLKKLDSQYSDLTKENLLKKIKVIAKTPGKRIDKIKINNSVFSGTEIRSAFKLNSTNFEITEENNKVLFNTIGFGHGMGLSQFGANEMALRGYNFEDILNHYYYKINIMKVY